MVSLWIPLRLDEKTDCHQTGKKKKRGNDIMYVWSIWLAVYLREHRADWSLYPWLRIGLGFSVLREMKGLQGRVKMTS